MFELDNTMIYIEPILLNNNFKEVGSEKKDFRVFENEKCTVEVDLKNEIYNILYRDKTFGRVITSSDNLNIYFLFGYLSANDLVDRDFKI